eukprot:ctg_2009.g354
MAPPRHHPPSASGYGGSLSASVYIGRCANCGTTETPGWRQGETADQRLCNACGLFWAKYRKQRPGHLWKKEVDKQAAMTAAATASSRPVSRAPTAERSTTTTTTTTTGTATGTVAAATVATATRASPHTQEPVQGVRPRQENAPDPTRGVSGTRVAAAGVRRTGAARLSSWPPAVVAGCPRRPFSVAPTGCRRRALVPPPVPARCKRVAATVALLAADAVPSELGEWSAADDLHILRPGVSSSYRGRAAGTPAAAAHRRLAAPP